MANHRIRTVFETDIERAQGIGGATILGRHMDRTDEFGLGVLDLRTGESAMVVFAREDMAALRDALNRELAS